MIENVVMNVKNRSADIKKMRSNILQEYVKLIAKAGWKQALYSVATDPTEKQSIKDKYNIAYQKMRDFGIDKYSYRDMDVSLIRSMLDKNSKLKDYFPTNKTVYKKLIIVCDDRNDYSHLSDNENDGELYIKCLFDLLNLKEFVQCVDIYEDNILDDERLNFRQTYIPEIDKLMTTIDDERFTLYSRIKAIDTDINKIKTSNNPGKTWMEIYDNYSKRAYKIENNDQLIHDFIKRASDAGIVFAHSLVASYDIMIVKDYEDAKRRLLMRVKDPYKIEKYEANDIIENINLLLYLNCSLSGLQSVFSELINRGFTVCQCEDAYFAIK